MCTGLLRASLPLLLLSLVTREALAQPVPGTDPEPPVAPPSKTDASADAMLTPIGPAKRTLEGWEQALALASADDPDYSIALLEIERSLGEERQALGGALPTLTGTGNVTFHIVRDDVSVFDSTTGATRTLTIPSSPTASASLVFRQPLIAARVWYGIGTASRATDAARLSADDRRRRIVAGVAEAIVAVVTAERISETNRVGLRAALERLTLQRRRLELGSGTLLDVVRFEQDVVAARGTLIEGDETLRQARERLGLSLGSVEPFGVKPDISLDDIERTVSRMCKGDSLESRSDILALKAQKEIAERAVTDADLLYVPTADLTSTATVSSEDLVGDKNYAWSIQGVLTIPIWDGGVRYGVRRSAKAVVEQQQQRLTSLTRAATVEVGQAERSVLVATASLEVATKARDLAAETDRLAQRAFENGASTSFDLVDAARRLREAELTLAVRELELVRSKIAAVLARASCKT